VSRSAWRWGKFFEDFLQDFRKSSVLDYNSQKNGSPMNNQPTKGVSLKSSPIPSRHFFRNIRLGAGAGKTSGLRLWFVPNPNAD
jgi:hypothetical protein